MKKHSLQWPLLSMVGLLSVLVLDNHAMVVNADPNTSPDTFMKNSSVTKTQTPSATAEAPYWETNQHSNLDNHKMGDGLTSVQMKSETDESKSTKTEHIMQAPIGLDQDQSAEWLTWAKSEAANDFKTTGRVQKIVQVAATVATKRFAIGDTSVPHVDAVDVASYQNWMTQGNYNTLKSKGVKSAIVKISEGSSYANPYAKTSITYARNAGLQVGVYHYARFNSTSSAASEARKVISTMTSLGMAKSTRIFADMEDADTNVSGVGNNLRQFWSTLSAAGYTNHGVYTGGGQGQGYASAVANTVGSANTWYAAYLWTPTASSTLMNSYGFNYGAWQFSSTAYIGGTSGQNIDVSHDYSGVLGAPINLDYSPRYLGHEIASGRSESNVWSVANTD
ncbi:GH25 family lysozyme [Lacticaseibacillus paracasei]|uniref:GH25 family lysozyme n=1 Tax=Lacticaseibacillus paracasei TaxID=1597 RepID=UPI003D0653BB